MDLIFLILISCKKKFILSQMGFNGLMSNLFDYLFKPNNVISKQDNAVNDMALNII